MYTLSHTRKSESCYTAKHMELGLKDQTAPLTAARIAQTVARMTAERKAAGSIPGTGPILRVLKVTGK